MSFGAANAAEFQRLMNKEFTGLLNTIVMVYTDDIIIPYRSLKQRLNQLEIAVERLEKHNLTLKLSKCNFFCQTVEYLRLRYQFKG